MARQLSSDASIAPDAVSNLLDKSRRHLEDGVDHFATLGDVINHALLLSNIGRLNRVKAFCLTCREDCDAAKGNDASEFSEEEIKLYTDAIFCYQRALSILGQRKKKNSGIFDTGKVLLYSTGVIL